MSTWIGPYEVVAELGRGASGVVYRARSTSGVEVALKVIAPGAVDPARRARELEVVRSLGPDAGFVPVLDAGDSPAGAYLVMPLLTGGTLRDRLTRGPLPAWEVRELGLRLADALGRAHEAGIVHRDVKPENVLFDSEGEPFLADLGVAKPLDEAREPGQASLTRAGDARGTPGYMPLEQLVDAKSVGPEADVFALGAVLYECLTGCTPFERPNLVELFVALESGAFESLRLRNRDVPRDLAATIERALRKDPRARFANGEELALALEPRRSTAARSGAILVLVTAAAVSLWAATRPRGQAPPRTGPSTATAAVPSFVLAGRLGSTRFRHAAAPTALALGPGTRPGEEVAVVGDASGSVTWWRIPDGEQLFSATVFGGTEIRVVAPVHGAKLGALVLGAHGRAKYVVPADSHGTELVGDDAKIVAIATAWKKPFVASADAKSRVKIWDLDARRVVLEIKVSGHAPSALAFAKDDATVLIGAESGGVQAVRFDPKRVLPPLFESPVRSPVETLAVAPDGRRLALSLRSGDTFVVDLAAGGSLLQGGQDLPRARALSFAPGGALHGASEDGAVFAVDLARRAAEIEKGVGHGRGPGIAVSARGEVVYLSGPVGTPRVRGQPPDEGHEGAVLALLALPGKRLVSGGADGTVRLWDLETARELACARDHGDAVVSVVAAPDGGLLSGSRDGVVIARDAVTLAERARSRVPGKLKRVRVTPDGTAWAATDAGLIRVGDQGVARSSSGSVVALEVADDRILAWERDGALALVDPRTGEARWRRGLGAPASRGGLAVLGDERAAVAESESVRLVDLATGRDLWPAPVRLARVAAIEASPDGRYLAVAHEDDATVLRVATGEVVTHVVVTGRLDGSTTLAFAGDELLVGLARGPIARVALGLRR